MGFFNKIFGGGGNEGKKETSADRILRIIKEKTMTECVTLIPEKGTTKPWESKIGGVPYMPKGFDYPYEEVGSTVVTEGQAPVMAANVAAGPFAGLDGSTAAAMPSAASGETVEQVEERKLLPLRFLAQVNFSEMPPLEGFPTKGILPFYIAGENVHGLNFENPEEQKGFRVIYHEVVVEDESALLAVLPTDGVEYPDGFPVDSELKLNFEKSSMPMGGGDYRFDKLLLDAYNEANPDARVSSLDRAPEDDLDKVYDQLDMGGHRIGGYPFFTQLDPREYHQELKENSILLFQLDSEETNDYKIMWGDSGVCNFFIRPENLAKRDFSRVLYHWDCY